MSWATCCYQYITVPPGSHTLSPHNDPHGWVAVTHLIHQLVERGEHLCAAQHPAENINGAKMHGNHVGRALLQPVDQVILGHNLGGLVAWVALVVAVECEAVAVLARLLAADYVDVVPFLLESLPDPGTPAAVVGDGVAEGHPPHCRSLRQSQEQEGDKAAKPRARHLGCGLDLGEY